MALTEPVDAQTATADPLARYLLMRTNLAKTKERPQGSWRHLSAAMDDAVLELTQPGRGLAAVALGGDDHLFRTAAEALTIAGAELFRDFATSVGFDPVTIDVVSHLVLEHLLLVTPRPTGSDIRIDVVHGDASSDLVLVTSDRSGLLTSRQACLRSRTSRTYGRL